jgi:hypothetical protein
MALSLPAKRDGCGGRVRLDNDYSEIKMQNFKEENSAIYVPPQALQ